MILILYGMLWFVRFILYFQNNMRVLTIIWEKFLVELQETSLQKISSTISKIVLALFLLFFLVDIPENIKRVKFAIFWHDMIFLKIFVSFLIVFRWSDITSLFDSIGSSFQEFRKKEWDEWLWVPIIEIVDYLFLEKKFPRAETMAYFGISRSTADLFSEEMEKVKILIRWENNAKVLNPQFSRADVVSILSNIDNEGRLSPLFRKIEWGYSHLPSYSDTWFLLSKLETNRIE